MDTDMDMDMEIEGMVEAEAMVGVGQGGMVITANMEEEGTVEEERGVRTVVIDVASHPTQTNLQPR